ncbi:L-dopachrome tautomerase-related protein [Candidatus Solirubrobacter pratensis]|uniref:L-dopachrome tautomerase-related protein n=1 Tax=Candidatus Solirubrobacter pratensis TaxID=1298857 RepID=UPI0018CB3927|nr:L-dopachrome tautomerase-related protein [Candidatus Solirubrobacter pratensis]
MTVADDGRLFVCYPRWGDPVDFTVAELRDGGERAYPSAELNGLDKERPGDCLVSVQSVVVDPSGRLWLLDTGATEFGPAIPHGPKLVCVDPASDEVVQTIRFSSDVALETTYLNDIRFDLRRGDAGMAFITDSGVGLGPTGLIVVDLASGRSWRKLTGHPAMLPVDGFLAIIEGRPLPLGIGVDGIAISADGDRLFVCPLASRRLLSVSVDALANEDADDDEVAATLEDHGEKGASDGLESDADGRVYASNYEHGAILVRQPGGEWETLVHREDLLFVDTLAVAADGHIYYTVNQVHRQPAFQGGNDLRERPYALMRTPIQGAPVRLRR